MRARRENAKPSFIRRVLACLVSAAMVVAFTPVVAWGEGETGGFSVTGGMLNTDYTYSSNTLIITSGTPITISGTTTANRIFVEANVSANITLENVKIDVSATDDVCAFSISNSSTVNLTLEGTNTLKSGSGRAGLQVPSGSSLAIAGSGSLTATGNSGGAGIGGGLNGAGGTIAITGGTVIATGELGAGIGGGYGADQGGSVRITGGTVEAKGATGIGGGYSGGDGGSVTISGGTVTATSNSNGAGIGGGYGGSGNTNGGNGGTVTISGGTVTAIGESGSAGIGGGKGNYTGNGGNGGAVTITGGTVIATAHSASTDCGAGTGGGNGGSNGSKGADGTFKTNDGTNNGNAVVLASSISDTSNQDSWSGVIFKDIGTTYSSGTYTFSGGSGAVYGSSATPSESFTMPSGSALTINDDQTLTIAENTTLTNNGTITNNGKIYVDGSLTDNASSKTGGEVYYPLTLNGNKGTIGIDGDTSNKPGDITAIYGKAGGTVTLTPVANTGYEFDKWVVSPETAVTDNSFTMPSQATTVTAQWKAKQYTVTFDSKGGTAVAPITVDHLSMVAEPADPTKTGYKFTGWYTTSIPMATTLFSFLTPITENTKLYAGWTADIYTIDYVLNGGTIDGANPTTYTVEDIITLKPAEKSGYTFGGWYDGDTKVEQISPGSSTGNKTLTAKWLSQDTSVQKVVVKGVEGTISGTDVSVTLPYNVALPTQDSDFVITPAQGAQVTTPPVKEGDVWKFVVTAEDGVEKATYTVTVKQQPAPYVPPSDPSYNVPAEGEGGVAVKVTVSGSTAVVAEISASALESAAGSGAVTVTIDLSGLPKGVTEAQLSKSTVDKLLAVVGDAGNAVESVTVKFGSAVLVIDAKALAAIVGQMKGANVTLGVRQGTADSLNSAQKKALSPFEVVQLYFEAQIKSGGAEIHDFGGGSVRVSVAFAPKPGHDPARYVVLYVAEDGSIERYATAWAAGMLSFTAPHFSAYAVVYVEDEAQATIDALEAVPSVSTLKASQAKEAVKKAEAALAQVAALDDGQKMLVDEALVVNAQDVVVKGAELIAQADKKAVGKVKDKAFSVKAGKSKSIAFKTKMSAAGTTVAYKKASGSKYISVTKTGKVTAKKGMKKGKTYTATVKVTCGASTKTVKVTVRVR